MLETRSVAEMAAILGVKEKDLRNRLETNQPFRGLFSDPAPTQDNSAGSNAKRGRGPAIGLNLADAVRFGFHRELESIGLTWRQSDELFRFGEAGTPGLQPFKDELSLCSMLNELHTAGDLTPSGVVKRFKNGRMLIIRDHYLYSSRLCGSNMMGKDLIWSSANTVTVVQLDRLTAGIAKSWESSSERRAVSGVD